MQHGLTTRAMHFSSDEEEREFIRSRQEFHTELQPKGIVQRLLVDEIAATHHKLTITLSLGTQELAKLRKSDYNAVDALFFPSRTCQ